MWWLWILAPDRHPCFEELVLHFLDNITVFAAAA